MFQQESFWTMKLTSWKETLVHSSRILKLHRKETVICSVRVQKGNCTGIFFIKQGFRLNKNNSISWLFFLFL